MSEMSSADLQAAITQAVQAAVDPLITKMATLEAEMKELQSTVRQLQEELSSKDKALEEMKSSIEIKLDEREQYSRRNNLRIFGISETEDENTDDLVMDVAKRVGVPILHHHLDRSHRLGRKSEQPRPIIVKFVSYANRREVFSAKSKLKGTGVTIREDLTRTRLSVLKKAAEAYTTKCVWTNDGVIMIKLPNLRHPLRVSTEPELAALIRRHPPE